MSSILGLPTRGSDVTIHIAKVHLHPLCVLVEFWGKFCQDRIADYECLAKDIQYPGNVFQEFEGYPSDQCLVEVDGTWYRARIVSRNGLKYSVFLIDKGVTCSTTTTKLAWGKKSHFHLPPEVEFCVLANVLPLSPENRWSPVAFDFLKSLSGKSVKAHVQDVLVQHRTFVLHIPCISKQMYEMGIARKLSTDVFLDSVLMSLQSHSGTEASPDNRQTFVGAGERLHKQEFFMYPELPAGTVETVIVTDVTNPQRIFCQLRVFSQELKKLSEQITQCYEGRMTNCIVGPEMIGFPCAARGSDGRWYRSVLQQVFQANKVVEVLNVDYGTKQFVQVKNVRPLAAEFFRMPVVTYICSLHGIIDKGVGWTSSQIEYLRTLLLCKTVIAKFEYQSISEGVHYVTLYGDENTNINNLFGSKESYSLECEKTLGDYAIRTTAYSRQHSALQKRNQRKMLTPGQAAEEKEGKETTVNLPAEDPFLNSSHVAVVQHVSDPSEFWVQMQNHTKELDELMDSIYHLYKDSVNKDVVRNPTVGLYCAAKAEDGDFYRATVAEVGERQIKVFFIDYGNTEVVDGDNVRVLPDKFKKLPHLALKCTLAGVRPKEGRWSRTACEFFIKAVKDKVLRVHVTAKYDEGYVVQLTDPEAYGEKDLTTLMCSSGFAERTELQRQPKPKMTTHPAILPPIPLPDTRLSGLCTNNGMSFQTPNTTGPARNERRIPSFKEHMFPIGSVLDVNVSYIESPNDFWCQLVHNAGHLKLLMHDIQAYYAGSKFQPLVDTACVACHPDNGMWYRALVIHKHETPHVDVLFVDYGQTEMVSLYDLRRICPEFLALHGQAFRCSLLNPVDPTSATNEWNDEAVAKFQNFVETAASNFVILKCTIYAVMYSEQKIVFNIVDLETPFESVSTSMVNLVKSMPPKKAGGPSFRLDTYYYSTHNVKTGTEEEVTVTCVNNVRHFYCQLERNADVIKDLKIKVSNLCHQLENVKLPTVFGTLCFAKYTDGQWYRAQIKATKPVILVHFVDYGDTIEVEKSDLLPVPREANDIMSVPVQAVVCRLSDVPADVPNAANSWFETNATECKFRALVVAREPDGRLLVELYHGNTQINSKIKKMFQIEMHTEEQVLFQSRRALEASANFGQKTTKAVPKQAAEVEDHTQAIKKNLSAPKPACQMRDADINLHSARKPFQKVKAFPLELYRPPHQRQPCGKTPGNTGNGSDLAGTHIKPRKESIPTDTKQLIESKSPGTECQKENRVEKLPKLADLPSKSITSGMEADVYVSHCNSPSSFYVQLVQEEDEIFSLVEKLNDPQFTPKTGDIIDVHPGDLVQAEFADDSSWYRAVVREIHSNTMALVEFIDFGNTSMVPISKMGRLHKSFLLLPLYSTHCMMGNTLGKDVLDPEEVSAFREDIGGNAEKVLNCRFIRQSGSVWEVRLRDSGMNLLCEAPVRCTTDGSTVASEKLELEVEEKSAQDSDIRQMLEDSQESIVNSSSLRYHRREFSEGQKLEVYITTTNDVQTFWCHTADSEELDQITSSVAEVMNAAVLKHTDPQSLSLGSPCIALLSNDQLWYRAEVIDKDGDDLSVLFVDYGNKSRVNVTDVREVPPDLMETPPQAFLCELEGFDASRGCWDSGAVSKLSALTTDKVLQLTVTRVTRQEGKIKCLVQVECEGQVINETLKTWWKTSVTGNQAGAVGQTTSYETPQQCASTVNETALPEDQLAYPQSQEMDIAAACVHSQTDHTEEQSAGELVDPHTAGEVPKLTSSPKHNKSSEESLLFESVAEEERDLIVSECNMTTGPQRLSTAETLREAGSNEGENIVSTTVVSQTEPKDSLPGDRSTDEAKLPPLDNKDDQGVLTFEEESASASDTISPDDLNTQLAIDESDVASTDLESLPEEVNNRSVESIINFINISDSDRIGASPLYAPTEHEIEAGDGVTKEEVPCVATYVEVHNESMAPYRELPQELVLALPSDTEPQSHIVPCPDLSNLIEEVTCLVGEICLKDVCRDAQKDDTQDSEQLVHTPPEQKENFSDEEMSTSFDDDGQLSRITHLSLIITDGPADLLPEQQPEE
ncbi:tudor domain-containing 6 [Pempheris klunzingeri]|uniref:tudor domain-containing 6 n=1 Tax=Pempheris klunzingeri TaxID=3127111 RepID=UPI003980D9AD